MIRRPGTPLESSGADDSGRRGLVTADDDEPLIAKGEWRGSILTERRGDGGFGYDPVFLDPESGKSSAERDLAATYGAGRTGDTAPVQPETTWRRVSSNLTRWMGLAA